MNDFDGSGYKKTIKLDYKNRLHFWEHMVDENLIKNHWLDLDSTLAIVMVINFYNVHTQIAIEKRIVLEFFEEGGLINLEHQSTVINMALYRNFTMQIQSAITMLAGVLLVFLSIIDIKDEAKAKQQALADAKAAEEEGDEEDAAAAEEDDGEPKVIVE